MGPSGPSLGLVAGVSHGDCSGETMEGGIRVGGSGRDFQLSNGRSLRTTQVFEEYWKFACERQEVFYRRLRGGRPPWSDDSIFREYRFTNAYRAADRVSQFLIREVIYSGDQSAEEVFFRTILFKLFNRIDTWRAMTKYLGPPAWKGFTIERYNEVLECVFESDEPLYSAAYIMPNPPFGRARKHTNHLILLSRMMHDGVPSRVVSAKSLRQVFEILRSYPSIGDFLAFQYAIDLNYSELLNFSEMECVVAGPGARSGIMKAFVDIQGFSEEEVIREVTHAAPEEFARRGLTFRTLGDRQLQLIDCQNLFCEVDKYSRVAHPGVEGNGRMRIKRRFRPLDERLTQWYPPKWRVRWPESGSERQRHGVLQSD